MTELTTTTTNSLSVLNRINELSTIADIFNKSGLFTDIKSQSQAFVKVMAGAEMGIPPFTAMNSFHLIKGRVTMSAAAVAARIKASGRYDYRIVEKSGSRCVIDFYENGKKVYTETWDTARAAKAGTQNMNAYPDAMLFARAITSGARSVCPDIVGQYYTPEEMGAVVDEEGEIVEGNSTPAPVVTIPRPDPLGRNGQDSDFSKATTDTFDVVKADVTARVKAMVTAEKQAREIGDTKVADKFASVIAMVRAFPKNGTLDELKALQAELIAATTIEAPTQF